MGCAAGEAGSNHLGIGENHRPELQFLTHEIRLALLPECAGRLCADAAKVLGDYKSLQMLGRLSILYAATNYRAGMWWDCLGEDTPRDGFDFCNYDDLFR